MKVAIIDHVGIKAGMDCYDLALSQALNNRGYETFIYSNFQSDKKGVFDVFNFRIGQNLVLYLKMLWTFRQISKDISRRQIRECILHGFRFGLAEWMMVKALKNNSVKLNMIVHDPESLLDLNHSGNRRKKIFRLCNSIIVHNNYSAGELSRGLNDFESRKLVVIPHGHFIDTAVAETDIAAFKSKNLFEADKKYLLFFGHIKKTKGLDLLLKALAQTDSDVHLIIAGRMRKHGFDEYMILIDKYKLQKRIKIFPGYISPKVRNELFQMADAVVLPYRKVFQSGVLLMAMSYGKAVIASGLLPIKEIITDGKNGFLFQLEDESSLSSVINWVLKNDAMRKEVAKAGKEYVRSAHDWNLIADQWVNLFSK